MSIRRAIVTVATCTLLFSILGGLTGFLLGKWMPGYYRAVFSTSDLPNFDPVQLGLGLGATQGFTGGAIIGLALVGMAAWHGRRPVGAGSRSHHEF